MPHACRLLAVVLITCAALSPTLSNQFTNWDDNDYVTENPHIRGLDGPHLKQIFTKFVSGNYHPLTVLSFAVEYRVAGLNPFAYHLTNLLLHLANCGLVYALIFLITRQNITAFLTALVFGIHPLHVEAVAWISSRKDLLFSLFYLSGLLLYQRHLTRFTPSKNKFGLPGLFFILALLSKIQAVTFPVALLLLDALNNKRITRIHVIEKAWFWATAAGFVILSYFAQQSISSIQTNETYHLLDRIAISSYSFLVYAGKFIFPFPLSGYYPYPLKINGWLPWMYYISFPCVFLFIWGMIRAWKANRVAGFGLLFFSSLLVFNLKFVGVGGFIMADRYMYLPLMGLALSFSFILNSIHRKNSRILAVVFTACFILALSYTSYQRAQVWFNSETFWSDVIGKYPRVYIAYNNRGKYYMDQNMWDRALNDFIRAVDINATHAAAYNNLGLLHLKLGKDAEALTFFDKALRLNPDSIEALNNRGTLRIQRNDLENAAKDFRAALRLDPFSYQAHANLAKVLSAEGNYTAAINHLNKATAIEPNEPVLYSLRGTVYAGKKDWTAARSDFAKEIELDPMSIQGLSNLGSVFAKQGDYESAVHYFSRAIALDPDAGYLFSNRSLAFYYLNQYQRAFLDADAAQKKGAAVSPEYVKTLRAKLPAANGPELQE